MDWRLLNIQCLVFSVIKELKGSKTIIVHVFSPYIVKLLDKALSTVLTGPPGVGSVLVHVNPSLRLMA